MLNGRAGYAIRQSGAVPHSPAATESPDRVGSRAGGGWPSQFKDKITVHTTIAPANTRPTGPSKTSDTPLIADSYSHTNCADCQRGNLNFR
jgi:hypothetical protein